MSDLPFPDFDAAKELKRMLKLCARTPRDRRSGRPRWSVVSSATGHGRGYSAELCRWAGLDPDERVIKS